MGAIRAEDIKPAMTLCLPDTGFWRVETVTQFFDYETQTRKVDIGLVRKDRCAYEVHAGDALLDVVEVDEHGTGS